MPLHKEKACEQQHLSCNQCLLTCCCFALGDNKLVTCGSIMNPPLAAAAQAVKSSSLFFSGCKRWGPKAESFQHSRDGKGDPFSTILYSIIAMLHHRDGKGDHFSIILYSIIAMLHHSIRRFSMHSDSTNGAYFLAVPII